MYVSEWNGQAAGFSVGGIADRNILLTCYRCSIVSRIPKRREKVNLGDVEIIFMFVLFWPLFLFLHCGGEERTVFQCFGVNPARTRWVVGRLRGLPRRN